MGEALKAINENLLMGGRVRDRARTRIVREGARDRSFFGEGDGKVGRNEKKKWGKEVKGGVNERRKGRRSGDKGGVGKR